MSTKLYTDPKLEKKLAKISRDKISTIYKRSSTITPSMIGCKVKIHNGKTFSARIITSEMVGYKFGTFAPTRKFIKHGKAGTH